MPRYFKGFLRKCLLISVNNSRSAIPQETLAWKPFLHYWPFLKGMHRAPVDSSHEGATLQSFGAAFFYHSLIKTGSTNCKAISDLKHCIFILHFYPNFYHHISHFLSRKGFDAAFCYHSLKNGWKNSKGISDLKHHNLVIHFYPNLCNHISQLWGFAQSTCSWVPFGR